MAMRSALEGVARFIPFAAFEIRRMLEVRVHDVEMEVMGGGASFLDGHRGVRIFIRSRTI